MVNNKEKNFLSVVIYVYNAEKRIESFLDSIIKIMEENFEYAEIICVNDSSEDDSYSIIKEIGKRINNISISVLNMSFFHGLEMAMNAGVDFAIGDFIFEFDHTYLDFNPNVIMEIYRHCLKGYDIVTASAKGEGKISSKIFYKFFEKYSGTISEMTTESFRIISRRGINRIKSMNRRIPYRKVVYLNCGLKTDNIKYEKIVYLHKKTDKREQQFRVELAINSFLLFTQIGYRFAKTMTIMMMLLSVFMIIYSSTIYLTAQPVAGWTTTIMFLSVAFFGLFGILTFVIKYLQLIIDLVFKKREYIYESIEKITN